MQAANRNARHALITGERGIGKSSFSSQLQGIARGESNYLALVDAEPKDLPFTFLAVEHIAQDGQGPTEIAAGLLKELDASKGLARFARFNLDFTIDLGPLTTSVTQKSLDPQDAVTKFIDGIQQVADHVKNKVDGIILIVDEIDRVAAAPGVSTFFKVATERLSSRGLENVSFILIGLTGTLESLRAEHDSVSRIFKLIEVPLLEDEEGIEILIKALKNTDVSIDEDAAQRLVELSGGYANAVHLLGEQAYDLAIESGNEITVETVAEAARLAVTGSAKEDFDPTYLSIKGRARNIIKFMAAQDARDVPAADVIKHLKVKATDVSAYFDTLMRSDVVVRPTAGVYRIREPLFREYLRHLEADGSEPVQRRPQRRS